MAAATGLIAPILPLFAHRLGANLALTGVVVGMNGVGVMIFDLPAGFFVSRFNKKLTITISVAAAVVIAVITGINRSLFVLALLSLGMGAVQSIWMIVRLAYIREVVPVDKRGRTLSLMGGLNRIGTFVGPIAGGFLGKLFGLHMPFFVQALVAAIALVIVISFVGPASSDTSGKKNTRFVSKIGGILNKHRRSFVTTGFAMVALCLIRSGRSILIPLWGNSIGLDVAAIGLIIGLSSAVDMTLFYPVGVIMDRKGRKWTAIPCLVILSLSLALIPLTSGFSGLLLVGLLAGIGNGLGSGINMTLGSDLAPRDGIGEFLGVWRLVGDVGTASGPLLIGVIAQVLTLAFAPFAAAGFGFVGAGIMFFFAAETLPASRDPEPPASR